MTPPLPARLWVAHRDRAEACLDHPFVQGLGRGDLPRAVFAGYVGQDAYFLESFARAYAMALARSPDRHALFEFSDLLQGVVGELKLHRAYAKEWGLDLGKVAPRPATLAYTRFLLAQAGFGTLAETAAAMTPCMRLYAWLGQQLDAAHPDHAHAYSAWITTYASPDFEALAARLEALLDLIAPPDQEHALSAVYRQALDLELAFFEAAKTGFGPA